MKTISLLKLFLIISYIALIVTCKKEDEDINGEKIDFEFIGIEEQELVNIGDEIILDLEFSKNPSEITKVEFYLNNTLIFTDNSSPFSLSATPPGTGEFPIDGAGSLTGSFHCITLFLSNTAMQILSSASVT